MEDNDNKISELISGLNSPDESVVSGTLRELRYHGNIHVLPALFSLFFSNRMESLDAEIESFINDIKDPEAVPVFIQAIEEYRGRDKFRQLVSACWQSGLDFSSHIDVFINLVIEEKDYYTAVEAFSVVEENVNMLSSQQRSARLEHVRSRIDLVAVERRMLVNELLSILSQVSGPFRLDPDHVN